MNEFIVNTDPFLLFFGCFYIVLGASAWLAPKSWDEFIDLFIEHDAISLVMGIITLPIALFIIFFYNKWDSIASTVLMCVGYLALMKSVILLLYPSVMQNIVKKKFVRQWFWLDGISGVVLGLAMIFL